MKINPIGEISCRRDFKQRKHVSPIMSIDPKISTETKKELSFKSKSGSLGSLIGTFAGIGLGAVATLATGGLAAPLLLGIGGCAIGGITGEEIGDRLKNNKNKSKD